MSHQEILPVCDTRNRVVGEASREEIHRQGLRHRSVHVLVFNGRGDLLLQRRGLGKDTYPDHWDTSVGGHQGVGETAQETARRELWEELGIRGDPARLATLPASEETGHEFVTVFTLVTEEHPRIDGIELAEGRWFSPGEVDALLAAPGARVTPSFRAVHAVWRQRRDARAGKSTSEVDTESE